MTEREKILAGQLYNCGDLELITSSNKVAYGNLCRVARENI